MEQREEGKRNRRKNRTKKGMVGVKGEEQESSSEVL